MNVEGPQTVNRNAVERAERELTALRSSMREEGGIAKSWASELMKPILILREALE